MSTAPVHTTDVKKQGDGSHIVRVIHSISGASTDVVFPYTSFGEELAHEYAAWKLTHASKDAKAAPAVPVNDSRDPRSRVADPFGGKGQAKPPVVAPVAKVATVVNTPPAPAPVEPEVVKVPVPAGDNNPEVKALEADTKAEESTEAGEETAEEAPAQE